MLIVGGVAAIALVVIGIQQWMHAKELREALSERDKARENCVSLQGKLYEMQLKDAKMKAAIRTLMEKP